MRVYITTVLTIVMSGLLWLGFGYLVTGFGLPYGMGLCTGATLMLTLMWYGGVWTEGARHREERRRLEDERRQQFYRPTGGGSGLR